MAASASVYLALLRNVEFFFENEISLWCVFARDAKVLSAVAPARVYAALLRKFSLFLENEMDFYGAFAGDAGVLSTADPARVYAALVRFFLKVRTICRALLHEMQKRWRQLLHLVYVGLLTSGGDFFLGKDIYL